MTRIEYGNMRTTGAMVWKVCRAGGERNRKQTRNCGGTTKVWARFRDGKNRCVCINF